MTELTSPAGSLAVAISALLLVLGYRLARPVRAREWLALAAYAVALAAQALGALGFLGGAPSDPGVALRLAGGGLLVAGILLAGAPSRARRAAAGATPAPSRVAPRLDLAYAGLALILVGQLLRGPSRAGALAVAVAVLLAGWPTFTPRPGGSEGRAAAR